MDELEDDELVRALLRGDRAAANVFVRRYRYSVMRVLRGFHQFDQAEVEDLFQDVFSKLFAGDCAALARWNRTGSLAAYVSAIARNAARDHLRATAADELVEPLEDPDELVGDAVDPQTLARISELRRMMRTAIQQIGPPHTEVITLVDLEGLSNQAAAQRLGVTANHLGVQLHVARQRLRSFIMAQYPALHALVECLD